MTHGTEDILNEFASETDCVINTKLSTFSYNTLYNTFVMSVTYMYCGSCYLSLWRGREGACDDSGEA